MGTSVYSHWIVGTPRQASGWMLDPSPIQEFRNTAMNLGGKGHVQHHRPSGASGGGDLHSAAEKKMAIEVGEMNDCGERGSASSESESILRRPTGALAFKDPSIAERPSRKEQSIGLNCLIISLIVITQLISTQLVSAASSSSNSALNGGDNSVGQNYDISDNTIDTYSRAHTYKLSSFERSLVQLIAAGPVPSQRSATAVANRVPPMNGSIFGKRSLDAGAGKQKKSRPAGAKKATSASSMTTESDGHNEIETDNALAPRSPAGLSSQADDYKDIITDLIENFLSQNSEGKCALMSLDLVVALSKASVALSRLCLNCARQRLGALAPPQFWPGSERFYRNN